MQEEQNQEMVRSAVEDNVQSEDAQVFQELSWKEIRDGAAQEKLGRTAEQMAGEAVRDWAHDHYRWAYALGTGVLCAGMGLMDYVFNEDPDHARAVRRSRRRAGLAYAAALGVGALLNPCVDVTSQAYGPALVSGNDPRRIALTFDDGPHPVNTPRVLEALRHFGIKASFFCVGQEALLYPDLVKQIVAEGHLVGSHGLSHVNLMGLSPQGSLAEIQAGAEALASVTGQTQCWFRPPYGMRYPWTMLQARTSGLNSVMWNNCPRDWQCPGPCTITKRVLEKILGGHIVLLHDGGGDRSQTVEALYYLIPQLFKRGYQPVRVDELN